MKIGIFYICTGKYSIFWDTFYASCQEYFIPEAEKHYYVFTDSDVVPRNNPHISIYEQSPKGFPLDSLLRFDMFISIEAEASKCDYLFFFNSNMQFQRTVQASEILPCEGDNGLVVVQNPGYYDKQDSIHLPFEKHRRSTAFIPYSTDDHYEYYMGGVNGGTAAAYYDLIHHCSKNIHIDMDNNVMALYHDESHLNQYIHSHKARVLTPSFGFPEDSTIPFEPVCVILNKMKHGGSYFDKLPTKSIGRRLVFKLKRLYWAMTWKMGM